jgi:hypothetical protein
LEVDSVSLTVKVLAQEILIIRDGEDWMTVPCAWGVDPSRAFLPAPDAWDRVTPSWLRGRRPEVVEAIERFGFVIATDDQPLSSRAFGSGDPPDPTKGPFPAVTSLEPLSLDELRQIRRRGR